MMLRIAAVPLGWLGKSKKGNVEARVGAVVRPRASPGAFGEHVQF